MNKKSFFKKSLFFLLIVVIITILLVIVRTYTYPFSKYVATNKTFVMQDTATAPVQRFAGGLRIPTVSNADYAATNFKPFDDFKKYLREAYPLVYKTMDTTTVNTYGLIFHWKGKSTTRKPVLFLSHYDVVPVNNFDPSRQTPDTTIFNVHDKVIPAIDTIQMKWDYPPFSGAVAGGRIYGRGTLDMKSMLFGLMEAATALIATGFQPERDVYFAFGHDEEVGGENGAMKMAAYFKDRNISFDAVYDEGGIIAAPGIAGINKAIALIGTAEKGFLTLKIKVKGSGGHSSMPPRNNSLVQAGAIMQLLDKDQMKPAIIPPVQNFLKHVGGEMPFASRLAIANQWLLEPVLIGSLTKAPNTNALVRTTTAITMAKGSDAQNVMPTVADVVVNFRLLPGDSEASVISHVKKVCKDFDIEIEVLSSRAPSGISPENTAGFDAIRKNISAIYPDAIITSYLTLGGTDAYKYQLVSNNVYRFSPVLMNEAEQKIIHGNNEYISIENYRRLMVYFKNMLHEE